jgi:hypothetical protein
MSGCSTTTGAFTHRHDVRTEYGVDPRLVSGALVLEPGEHVTVNPKRDGLLRDGVHDDGRRPEVAWQVGEFRRSGTPDLLLRGSSEPGQVCAAAHGLFRGG